MVRIMYGNRIRNMELPENLFSNLGEMKSKPINVNNDFEIKKDDFSIRANKFINYSDSGNYRGRINKMYDELNDIKPIDTEIDNELYFDNYIEKGIVVKPKVSSLKQFWTEYRLIDNEKKLDVVGANEKIDIEGFDELFDALSVRVQEINKYIDELKEMRLSINKTSEQLEKDKEKLINEREKFYDYKTKEESKLRQDRENLKINFSRLQTIIDDLDKKLENFDKD